MPVVDALLIFFSCCLLHIEPTMAVGATQNSLSGRRILALSAIFALVQAGITIIGVIAAQYLNALMLSASSEALVPYLTFALLIMLAAYMIFKAFHFSDFTEALLAYMTGGGFAKLALRWCPPIFLTGVILGISMPAKSLLVLLAFMCSLVISAIGLCYGYWQGHRFVKAAYLTGGVSLFILAVKYIAALA
jgi:putative Mn2+ efflux pump MntP